MRLGRKISNFCKNKFDVSQENKCPYGHTEKFTSGIWTKKSQPLERDWRFGLNLCRKFSRGPQPEQVILHYYLPVCTSISPKPDFVSPVLHRMNKNAIPFFKQIGTQKAHLCCDDIRLLFLDGLFRFHPAMMAFLTRRYRKLAFIKVNLHYLRLGKNPYL